MCSKVKKDGVVKDVVKEMYIPDDIWGIVKEFMLDWRKSWHKKWKLSLEVGIKCQYPRKLVGERYDMKTKLYYTTFRVPNSKHGLELRICSKYSYEENNWDLFWESQIDN